MKILLLAYYFPPDSSSGSFRPLYFANHLVEAGDDVTVLTARQEDFLAEQPLDGGLLSSLDQRVKVARCTVHRPKERLLGLRDRLVGYLKGNGTVKNLSSSGTSVQDAGRIQAAKDFVTDLLTTPDIHAGWILSCVMTGLKNVRKQRPDIILATGGPWSGLVAGGILKRLTGVRLALDFRDPWVSNPDHVRRGLFLRRIDTWLEKLVIESADLLIANTEELSHDFSYRYGSLSQERIVTITNGFEDYVLTSPQVKKRPLTLTHAGALYFSRNPRPLLEAARNVIEAGKINPDDLKLRFIGGISVDDQSVAGLLGSTALARCVEVVPRVTYEESLRAMGESDVLILYQPGFPLQVPRKLYDYMAARKPVLCVAEPGSATWTLVERFALGLACDNDASRLEEALLHLYGEWQNGGLKPLSVEQCDIFRNSKLSHRLRDSLEQTLQANRDCFRQSDVINEGTR